MNLLRSIVERRADAWGTTPSSWLLDSLGGRKTSSGERVTPATAEGIPVIQACVSILAETVAQLPLRLYRRTPAGREPATGDLADVLSTLANPFMTSAEFREVMMRWLCLWGDCYAEIERRGTDVVGLWPLASDRMVKDRDPANGKVRYTYQLRTGGQQVWTVWNEDNPPILHLKINSLDGFTGRSPITLLRESLGITMAADKHSATFFGNGALPDLVISKKGPGTMSPKARQNFVESWKEKFGGSAKAHGIALLEEEFTVTPITMPMRDAQFLELRSFQIEDGARVYRIPLFMLMHNSKESSWGTGIEQMGLGFVQFTLQPWLVRWEQAIARDLLTRKSYTTHYARFSVQSLMRGDSAARASFYTAMQAAGALSPNEVRAFEEMNGIEDGDEYFISANLKKLDAPDPVPGAGPFGAPRVPVTEPVEPVDDEPDKTEGAEE
jgi:HK97 family phage portal protein